MRARHAALCSMDGLWPIVSLCIRLGTICVCERELLFATVLWLHSVIYTVLSASHFSLLSFLNVAIDCFIILDKVFWHNLLFYDFLRYFFISWSHTQCQRDRDMSTLLLAIISLKRVTAYSRPLHTAPQIIIIFQLQFNYTKNLRILRSCGACGERRWAKPALSRRLSRIFFRPASRGLAKSTAA